MDGSAGGPEFKPPCPGRPRVDCSIARFSAARHMYHRHHGQRHALETPCTASALEGLEQWRTVGGRRQGSFRDTTRPSQRSIAFAVPITFDVRSSNLEDAKSSKILEEGRCRRTGLSAKTHKKEGSGGCNVQGSKRGHVPGVPRSQATWSGARERNIEKRARQMKREGRRKKI